MKNEKLPFKIIKEYGEEYPSEPFRRTARRYYADMLEKKLREAKTWGDINALIEVVEFLVDTYRKNDSPNMY